MDINRLTSYLNVNNNGFSIQSGWNSSWSPYVNIEIGRILLKRGLGINSREEIKKLFWFVVRILLEELHSEHIFVILLIFLYRIKRKLYFRVNIFRISELFITNLYSLNTSSVWKSFLNATIYKIKKISTFLHFEYFKLMSIFYLKLKT